MAEQKMPDVTGKGPALMREMLAIFKELQDKVSGLSADAADQIKTLCNGKGAEMEPLLSRAYMKTVKAGEVAWKCKEMARELAGAVANGNEAAALETLANLQKELDGLIHTTKTFVIRMT
ncbi:MAG: hypothetical protein ACUVRZ_03135 [Desulfobacca sp.]|uniref:hypothetical protein n=1 Tax=Desulfobacca sp. TaxID=2067990 RepID=UPI00404A2E01